MTKKQSGKAQSIFGAFWMIKFVMIVIPIWYLMNKATIVTDNPFMISVGTLVMFLAIIGMSYLPYLKVKNVTFGMQCFSYLLGAILATLFLGIMQPFDATSKYHFMLMGEMHVMESIRGSLSIFEDMWISTQAIPAAEEMAFLIVLPLTIFGGLTAFSKISKRLSFLNNALLQILITIPPTAVLFAYFHVGMAASATFFMMAVVFRTVLIALVYTDMRMNLIPFAALLPAFAVGVHEFWNINSKTGGNIASYVTIMMSDPFGYLSLGVQVFLFGVGIHWLLVKKWEIFK